MEEIKESLADNHENSSQFSDPDIQNAVNADENQIKPSVGQEEVQDLLFKREIGWNDIIYDLINTEQLDPWNVDLIVLTEKYLEKIYELEEQDFFISSQVMLAAALLLRIKSEILLNKHIKSIDDILFNRVSEKKDYSMERIELDEDIPELVPRSPMPRFKRVTLQELMESLNKAIITENRRIKKEIINKNALRESSISLPKGKTVSIKDKIKEIFDMITGHFVENESHTNVGYSVFVGMDKRKRIDYFSPLLHLENQKKVWLEQEDHFAEIDIWMKKTYWETNGDPFANLKEEMEEELLKEIEENEDAEIVEEQDSEKGDDGDDWGIKEELEQEIKDLVEKNEGSLI
jgi:segregation and condensation protein A